MRSATKERESQFELLRLVAMFTIVLYHIYIHHIGRAYPTSFNSAIIIPIHVGVPVFVLISGYWGIRVSGKGLARLLGQMAVYTIPMVLVYNHLAGIGGVRKP